MICSRELTLRSNPTGLGKKAECCQGCCGEKGFEEDRHETGAPSAHDLSTDTNPRLAIGLFPSVSLPPAHLAPPTLACRPELPVPTNQEPGDQEGALTENENWKR